MALQIQTRHAVQAAGKLGSGFAGSFVLHATVALILVVWAYFSRGGAKWGSQDATAGSIQATMVSAIPLPPKVPADENNVLATERPSIAPAPPAPPAVQQPKPDAIPIPTRQTKVPPPTKPAEKTTPTPPKQVAKATTPSVAPSMHPVVPTQPVNKATTGEAGGLRVAMSSVQNRAGTSSINVADQAFGSRFGYYVQQITQKVASQWTPMLGMLDANAPGHRAYINFDIQRDGTPTNIRIAQPSGDGTVDQTALGAVRRIDTFPPLPDAYGGSHINVTYYFDPQPHP